MSVPAIFTTITDQNYDQAYRLQTGCHAFPWSRAQFLDCLNEPYFATQFEEQDQAVGYYVGLIVSVEATLMDIGVAKELRGNGIGRELVKHFLRQCNKKQAQEAWLEVRVSNTSAINLYRDLGFELIEQRKHYYPSADGREDALIMRLILGQ